ncbi:protein refolding chaperone Spy/CpxP family [Rubritalea squalenifaciens DSM 18772]|uniref:Protein refolding chaperone Spy/CpxP family n=1 Tax=Rubritalea squalenifaciens DSM 18772 TaxID=1123071 RepID=A0A1M6DR58_9BACT|nr:periplasmic heavy metal sensor [Rubritalea squalenifaciens]SHI75468.1 protein refolding chaperone Spy/CpxP family [Rubritalea squalenifaciens DSM 18772]
MMRKPRFIILVALVAFIAGALGCWFALHWHARSEHGHGAGGENFHAWIHENLELSEQQEKEMHASEAAFHKKEAQLLKEQGEAKAALAHAVWEHGKGSPELETAIQRVNHIQGEMQRASLDHFFEMKEYLEPEQAEKMLQWLHDGIQHEHEQPHH